MHGGAGSVGRQGTLHTTLPMQFGAVTQLPNARVKRSLGAAMFVPMRQPPPGQPGLAERIHHSGDHAWTHPAF